MAELVCTHCKGTKVVARPGSPETDPCPECEGTGQISEAKAIYLQLREIERAVAKLGHTAFLNQRKEAAQLKKPADWKHVSDLLTECYVRFKGRCAVHNADTMWISFSGIKGPELALAELQKRLPSDWVISYRMKTTNKRRRRSIANYSLTVTHITKVRGW